jgi:hypothetical protein
VRLVRALIVTRKAIRGALLPGQFRDGAGKVWDKGGAGGRGSVLTSAKEGREGGGPVGCLGEIN